MLASSLQVFFCMFLFLKFKISSSTGRQKSDIANWSLGQHMHKNILHKRKTPKLFIVLHLASFSSTIALLLPHSPYCIFCIRT